MGLVPGRVKAAACLVLRISASQTTCFLYTRAEVIITAAVQCVQKNVTKPEHQFFFL